MTMDGLQIRPCVTGDAGYVARLDQSSPGLGQIIKSGGRAWLAWIEGSAVAYAAAEPVPGIGGLFDCWGHIVPAWRGRGVGTALLGRVTADLAAGGVERLSHEVTSLIDAEAYFLQRRGFYLEHEEWTMWASLSHFTATPELPAGCQLQTLSRRRAIPLFRTLYERSFRDQPWYQPFSHSEVSADLENARDLLFLYCGEEPVGVAWSHRLGPTVAEIEPIGILREQWRQGLGRALLLSVLKRLAEQGVSSVRLTVWRENVAAVRLYEDVGFRQRSRRFFLVYDL
jgi:ribosomal protein S18 acetylase RimI-like enzyme